MKIALKIILFIAAMFIEHICFGSGNYKFRTMSPEGGFYYDGVKGIEQDSDGFIWIVMDYELYRFDGFRYKKYYPYFSSLNHDGEWGKLLEERKIFHFRN